MKEALLILALLVIIILGVELRAARKEINDWKQSREIIREELDLYKQKLNTNDTLREIRIMP